MKKLIIILILMACPLVAHSQQLTVSATVTGPNGAWANGTSHASLVCAGNEQGYIGNSPISRDTPTVGLDGLGHFAQVLYDTSQIVGVNHNPITCNYVFRITESCGIANFSTGPLTGITGAGPVDLTSQINTFAVPLSAGCAVPAGTVTSITATAPIVVTPNPITGAGVVSCPSCGGAPSAPNTSVQFNNGGVFGGNSLFVWDNVHTAMAVGPLITLPAGDLQLPLADIGISSQMVNVSGVGGVRIPAEFVGSAPDGGSATFSEGSLSIATSTGTNTAFGFEAEAHVAPTIAQTIPFTTEPGAIGEDGYANNVGAGTVGAVTGSLALAENLGTGTLTNGIDYFSARVNNLGGGVLTNAIGHYFQAQSGGTNNYGAYFEDFGSGASAFGIFQVGSNTKNTLARLTVTDLTASNLVCTDSNKHLVSTAGCPAQYTKLRCDTGLGDGLNAVAAGTYLQTNCYNDSGVTWTITRIGCFTDNAGSSTLNATNGAATGLLTGAVTCTAAAGGAAGTQSGTTTIANGDVIKFTWVADGTSKQTSWFVSLTQ